MWTTPPNRGEFRVNWNISNFSQIKQIKLSRIGEPQFFPNTCFSLFQSHITWNYYQRMVYSLGYLSFVPPKLLEILEIPAFKHFITFRLNHREGDLLVKISVSFIPQTSFSLTHAHKYRRFSIYSDGVLIKKWIRY